MSKKLVSLVVGAVISALALTTACSSTTASHPGGSGSTDIKVSRPVQSGHPGRHDHGAERRTRITPCWLRATSPGSPTAPP